MYRRTNNRLIISIALQDTRLARKADVDWQKKEAGLAYVLHILSPTRVLANLKLTKSLTNPDGPDHFLNLTFYREIPKTP